MWCNVKDLHDFYHSPQGQMVQRLLSHHIHSIWPSVQGLRLGSYGYPLPYLKTFYHEAKHLLIMMPAPMGATPWPYGSLSKVVLCDENNLPLKNKCLDRLLLVHALEFTENTRALLREAWRVLSEEGEIMIVVPNRRGLWSCSHTPFGYGQPYTGRQLFDLLRNHLFVPQKPTYALYPPPLKRSLSYRLYHQMETMGDRWYYKMGGVVSIRAQKKILGGIPSETPSWIKRIFIPPRPLDA